MIKRFDVVPIFIGAYDETYNGLAEMVKADGKNVKYSDHVAEMREVLDRLSWRDQDLLDKHAHYLEEK